MRFRVPALLSFLIISSALLPSYLPAAAADTPVPTVPATVRRTLPSGLHLIVREMPGAQTTAVDLFVHSGSAADDPAHGSGAAHFLEHLVFKGTATRMPGDTDTAIEALGGTVDARTSRDMTQYAVTLPAGDRPWRETLTILADTILHPGFREADLEAERSVIRQEIAWARAEPMRLGYAEVYAAAFAADDPNHLPLMGSDESLAALTIDDVHAFHTAHYAPSNLTLVVAGDVRAADVANAATPLFPGSAPAATAEKPEAPVVVSQPLPGIVRAPRSARQTSGDLATVLIGLRAPGIETADDMPAIDVLMTVLDDGNGPSGHGRLYRDLIEKKALAQSVSAEYLPGHAGGLIILAATGASGDAGRLEAALVAEMDRLRDEPITDDELEASRNSALGVARYRWLAPASAARRLATWDALGLPPAFADGYDGKLAAVTNDDVMKVGLRCLTGGRYAVSVIGGAQ